MKDSVLKPLSMWMEAWCQVLEAKQGIYAGVQPGVGSESFSGQRMSVQGGIWHGLGQSVWDEVAFV